jgi:hypothetical protein
MIDAPGGPALVWREYWKEASRCTIQGGAKVAIDCSRAYRGGHIQEPLWTLHTEASHVPYSWKDVYVESLLHT